MTNKKYFFIFVCIFIIFIILFFNNKKIENKAVFCPQDSKLCSDGSYVPRIPPNCDFNKCPKEDLIVVENPKAEEEINSPLFISGKARGYWFFEGSFPIELVDEENNLISQTIAKAKDEWMTEEFVPFEAVLNFSNPKTNKGFLIFKKDNPSGMKKYDDEFKVPIVFSKKQLKEISLYYYNPNLDKDENGNILCSKKGIVEIKRQIPISKTSIKDTLELLLKGKQNLTQKDIENGITTEFPLEGFYLLGINLKPDGNLILNFKDDLNKSSGGSCRVNILRYQIEKTTFQFPEVKKVIFYPEDILEP